MDICWIFMTTLLSLNVTNATTPLESATYNEIERKALTFVEQAEKELHEAAKNFTIISWAYASNITEHNEKKQLEYTVSTVKTQFWNNT